MANTQLDLAFQKARSLSAERQEALAALILEEISSEERWGNQFSASASTLERLTEEALREDKRGETLPLHDSLRA